MKSSFHFLSRVRAFFVVDKSDHIFLANLTIFGQIEAQTENATPDMQIKLVHTHL